jgi:membrane protein DedA with SNARE-associated domain
MESILSLIHQFGYPILLILTIIEGPIVTVIASFLASTGILNVQIVYVVAFFGDIIGDIIYYYIGYFGRRKFLNKEKFLGIQSQKILGVKEHFENHGGKIILAGKLTHGVGFTTLVAAGVSEMALARFVSYSVVGTLPKVLFFVCLGFYFGKAYSHIDSYLHYITAGIVLLILIILIIYHFSSSWLRNQ